MPYEPIVPKGQHLGTSHEVDGAATGHLFEDGTNKLKGHAAWRWVDEPVEDYSSSRPSSHDHQPRRELTPEQRELAAQLAALILEGVIWAAVTASPHVKRWWNEKAIPAAASAWKRVTPPRKAKGQIAAATSSSSSRATFVASATGVEVVVAESEVSMSSAEWEHRFRTMLAAGAFREEQRQILSTSNTWVEDDGTALEARNSLEHMAPAQFAERIELMLQANPSLLNKETSAELTRIFSARPMPLNDQGSPELQQ